MVNRDGNLHLKLFLVEMISIDLMLIFESRLDVHQSYSKVSLKFKTKNSIYYQLEDLLKAKLINLELAVSTCSAS